MATLVTFHAHPDDEAIATGGTMAKAAATGHRVVLVTATAGEQGEVADGVLDDGESVGARRRRELAEAAEILGVARVELLGYLDSGMVGTPANDDPRCFWRADVETVAAQLAELLRQEQAEILTIYDERGNYGHPDHIQVHRVGLRAAALAGVPRVYEATVNRDELRRLWPKAVEAGVAEASDVEGVAEQMGLPEAELTTAVDVKDFLDVKRRAMAAHRSQIAPDSFFLALPADTFATFFGTEWYRRRGAPPGIVETDLLP